MSEAQEIDSPIAKSEENINNTDLTRSPSENEIEKSSATEDNTQRQKSESLEAPKNGEETTKQKDTTVPNDDTSKMVKNGVSLKREESVVVEAVVIDEQPPASPTSNTLDRNKAGECNLLPVLVERLRSALEQSCSSQSSSSEERSIPPEDSGVDSEEDLRVWASGLSNSSQNPAQRQSLNDLESPRGLKLDLKFLEDLLLSDIQTALGRLQETLMRVDIGTLTRYSSTLDPTNKLNLLKLISSLLANLKIPEESIVKPDKSAKSTAGVARRRRTDRHTIGVSSEELARARKWLEEKNANPAPVVEPINDLNPSSHVVDIDSRRNLENNDTRDKCENVVTKGNPMERLVDSQCQQFDKVPEKYMKDALNQQQSLQSKSGKDAAREIVNNPAPKLTEDNYKDDNTIINEEYGISASSLYHQANGPAKCNKFMAKKSKIKRANTIDIPNYLKLQAESLANGHGGVGSSLRRPINIGDKYSYNAGNVVPSFEPKTENDRKFLALINRNNETAAIPPSSSLPFKSFNYRQIATVADQNWNSRFSNIKTTFDKPRTNGREENNVVPSPGTNVVVGSLRIPCKQKPAGFSHAPTSPFRKIEKPSKDELTPSFLKPGYLSQNGSTLRAKVKMFDQENVDSSVPQTLSPLPSTKTCAKQPFNAKRTSNVFLDSEDRNICEQTEKSRLSDNGHLNYHSFCKQFAPFATKNPSDNHKSGPWSNGVGKHSKNLHAEKKPRERFEPREDKISVEFNEENMRDAKVPMAYPTSDFGESQNERKDEIRHRKQLYGTCEGLVNENGTRNSREIVAYPFEINYNKRPTFIGKKYQEATSEKGDYENRENIQQHSSPPVPPFSSLHHINAAFPTRKTPSPPPRSIFSTQNVAVQTHQTEPISSSYPNENRSHFSAREQVSPRRPAPPLVPNPMDHAPSYKSQNLPNEETRKQEDDQRPVLSGSRQYPSDVYQRSLPQRDTELPQFVAHRANYASQGRPTVPQSVTAPSHVPLPTNHYPPSVDYKSPYYPNVEHETTYPLENNFGKLAPPQVPARANQAPRKQSIPSVLKNQQDDRYDRFEDKPYEHEPKSHDLQNYSHYNDNIFYRDTQNPIYVPPTRTPAEREKFNDESIIEPSPKNYEPDQLKAYVDEIESTELSADSSFIEDKNIQNQDISSTEGVVTRYACAIATVSPVPESPALSPLPTSPNQLPEDLGSFRSFEENLPSNRRPKENESSYGTAPSHRDEESALDQARRHNLLQQNLIRQLQGEQSGVANIARRLSQETLYKDPPPSSIYYPPQQPTISNVPKNPSSQEMLYRDEPAAERHPLKISEDERNRNITRNVLPQEKLYRDEPTCGNLTFPQKIPEDEQPRIVSRNSARTQEKLYRDEPAGGNSRYPLKMPEEERHRNVPRNFFAREGLYGTGAICGNLRCDPKTQEDERNRNIEPIIESNNTQDKINIFEERNSSMKKHREQFKPLGIPRVDKEPFVPPKINVVSPSKVFKPSFLGEGDSRRTSLTKLPQKVLASGVDSSDEYLMSCASKPSRSIVLSKSESWHQLALGKNTLQVPQAQPCALLKPPKPKSPSSLKLSKQYEASSSSDTIRKMEEKIQRYFQGSSSGGQAPDSPVAARREPKNKRFSSRKSQGTLMRSQTMPHIFDDSTDVEKAFDSLFKEATRSDNRY